MDREHVKGEQSPPESISQGNSLICKPNWKFKEQKTCVQLNILNKKTHVVYTETDKLIRNTVTLIYGIIHLLIFFLWKNNYRRRCLARWLLILTKESSGYICWRSEFSLGFTLIHSISHLQLRNWAWRQGDQIHKMRNPKRTLTDSGKAVFNARNLYSLFLNNCWTPRRHWIPVSFKSRHSWQVSSGQPYYDHLFRFTNHKLILAEHSLYIRPCVLTAFSLFTHLIPISTLQRRYFHYFPYTEV